jgi:long-chain fatty acid transport protein
LEWSRWSRINTPLLYQGNGNQATIGGTPVKFPFQYSDGWFYSLGGEYMIDPSWMVRAGIAYEKSPITDGVRTPRLPDNDRMWYSVGATFKPAAMKGLAFDFGYSYISVKNAPLNLGPGTGNPWSGATTYVGSVNGYANIVSIGVRYQWDDAAPAPVKQVYAK